MVVEGAVAGESSAIGVPGDRFNRILINCCNSFCFPSERREREGDSWMAALAAAVEEEAGSAAAAAETDEVALLLPSDWETVDLTVSLRRSVKV